ncbi:MAG: aspartate aminotransferase family protein [Legionellales bacterium]|nr:aspartate aminotransferase family protein [Legionellales bacterium]OUX67080.1 MAG: hypothetical protein CBD38_03560 [bacterium TMED178]
MTKKYKTSLLVGGVNSPVRAGISVNADRFIASKAQGPFLFDQSGTPFLDYICGFGPILLGHQHPSIQATIADTKAFSALGVCNEFEEPLAHLIQKANPTIEKVRMTNSGGEAVNAAIRIAKAATKRTQIIKFSGQYHGAVESVLGYVMPSQSIDTGIDPNVSEQLSCLTFNDIAQLESAFKIAPPAAVIIEVISGNMGFIRAEPAFIQKLQQLCKTHQTMLIVDEVMTGFRVHPKGACALYDLVPDLITYGKIIGGGLPVGAVAGPTRLMDLLSPIGPVYQAGTFSGHPLAMACGVTTLNTVFETPLIESCHQYLTVLARELIDLFKQKGMPFCIDYQGGQFGFYFQAHYPKSFQDIEPESITLFTQFYHHMRKHHILLPPSHLEALFITGAHDDQCLEMTIEAARDF